MADTKQRLITAETEDFKKKRRAVLDALKTGLTENDMSGYPADPHAGEEDGFPVSTETEDGIVSHFNDDELNPDGYAIGLQLQSNVLQAFRRCEGSRRTSRLGALAMTRARLEDGVARDVQLDTLLLDDDTPVGYPDQETEQ